MKKNPQESDFLLGNEAIARGALESGVQVATGYPGSPSSEIIDSIAEVASQYGVYVEWSVNEKVAFEIALAGSYCRLRSICAMKHVGVNVAHDSVMTAGYIGARGGLLLVSCDDPGAWSSQNEQDNRFIARQAYFPVFEPCNPQEAKDMVLAGFQFSETYGQPVMLRSTTRVSHSTGNVTLNDIVTKTSAPVWEKRPDLLVYDSAGAKRNRIAMLQRFEKLRAGVEALPFNWVDAVDGAKLGVVGSGLSYSYVKEALRLLGLQDAVSVLKLAVTYPLPKKLVSAFLGSLERVLVVEELEPFTELHVKALANEEGLSLKVHGKDLLPLAGEFSLRIVTDGLSRLLGIENPIDFSPAERVKQEAKQLLPLRPPVFCPGCPHRASYFSIKRAATRGGVQPIFPGDIGCYGLGYLPPFRTIDACISMGGGLGLANGFAKLVPSPIVASIGDSTFFHAGIPALINAVHNNAKMVVCVLDNDVTAMTGEQPHPGSAVDAKGGPARRVLIEDVARGCGVGFVEVVDPSDFQRAQQVVSKALRHDGPAVIVFRRRCELLVVRERLRQGALVSYTVDQEKCTKCLVCLRLFACPAIYRDGGRILVDPVLCSGCGDCVKICPLDAFRPVQEA